MKFTERSSDGAVLAELGSRLTRCRLNRNLPQADLAAEAGVSLRTLQRIEQGGSTSSANLIRVLRALHLLGNLEALVPDPAASPIQQMVVRGKERRRASPRPRESGDKEPWSWGDEE